MGQSVNASEAGLAIADEARQRRGWTKTSTARWWQDAHTSRATLRRFWRGERIQQAAFIDICQAVGIENWEAIADSPSHTPPSPTHSTTPNTDIDWGDAPDIDHFYGRVPELAQLQQWAVQDQAKLIHISGIGGIGKTTLAVTLAEQLQPHFERIVWRSVDGRSVDGQSVNEQPDKQFPPDSWISHIIDTSDPSPEQCFDQLRAKIQRERWLLIVDTLNWTPTHWDAIARLTRLRHQSCIVVVSRDPFPSDIKRLNRIQTLSLQGISVEATSQLLLVSGCHGDRNQVNALAQLYSYNPLALKLVSATIQSVFDGAIAPFLEQALDQNTILLPDPIRTILQQQFHALTPLEQSLMFWLAIWQEPIALCRLQTHLLATNQQTGHVIPCNLPDVIATVSQLVERSLITRHFLTDEPSFGLQPMVMTVAINEFVKEIIQELIQAVEQNSIAPLQRLRTHSLVRPGTDDILGDRILTLMQSTYQHSPNALVSFTGKWLAIIHKRSQNAFGYLGSNFMLLNKIYENY